jgi:hypothetical protein
LGHTFCTSLQKNVGKITIIGLIGRESSILIGPATQRQLYAGCYNARPRGKTMPNLSGIVQQLKTERDRAQEEVEQLNAALMALGNLGSQSAGLRRVRSVKSRKPLSAAARKKIAAGQRARWAKWKAARRSK